MSTAMPVQGYAVPAQGQVAAMPVQGKPVQGQPMPVMAVPAYASQPPPGAGAMPVTAVATHVMPIMPGAPPGNGQFSHAWCSGECCNRTFCKGHCLMAWLCPCFLFARIAEHEGQHVQDSYPQGGWGPKLKMLLACYVANYVSNLAQWGMRLTDGGSRGLNMVLNIVQLCCYCAIIVVVMQLRELYRIKYGITNPADPCGDSDCFCACCCQPCAAQQMADNSFGEDAPCGGYLFNNPSTPSGRRPGPVVANNVQIEVVQTGNRATS